MTLLFLGVSVYSPQDTEDNDGQRNDSTQLQLGKAKSLLGSLSGA